MFHIIFEKAAIEDMSGNDTSTIGDANRFQEGEKMENAYAKAFLITAPFVLIMILVSLNKCKSMSGTIDVLKFGMCLAASFLLVPILRTLHEIIHALCYPKNKIKKIYMNNKAKCCFVCCDAIVSKKRYIFINIAPAIVLGAVPYMVWLLLADKWSLEVGLTVLFMTWYMVLMSMIDFLNIWNAMMQVPNHAYIFNKRMHSYWINDRK